MRVQFVTQEKKCVQNMGESKLKNVFNLLNFHDD